MLLIGSKLVVKGAWDDTPTPDGRREILLNPSILTFGTGYHPSTRTFLNHLEAGQIVAKMSVLDIGTGTGILAIAAAHLGASRVYAVDLNPQAVIAAVKNVQSSGVNTKVKVSDTPPDLELDLVLCNVDQLDVAIAALPFTKSGGLCAVSVEGKNQVAMEAQAVVSGFSREIIEPFQQWVYLAFRRSVGG